MLTMTPRPRTDDVSVLCPPSPTQLDDRPISWRPPPEQVALIGRSSVSPFMVGADRRLIWLADGGVAGYVRCGRWAVFATDPATGPGTEESALDDVLAEVRRASLRPVFVAVVDPSRYARRGLHVRHVADDACIDLASFSLTGKRRSSIRHSVTSARRAGVRVEPYAEVHADGCAAISEAWLATKRGGELGFTLGRFDPAAMTMTDCRVALDGSDRVVGFVTWHQFDGGRARVLDLMRRLPDAPNPTMDLLIAESIIEFRDDGIETVSLGCVPVSFGSVGERIYPTRSLRRFKDKFAPTWEQRFLVAPRLATHPTMPFAVARAYCPHGLRAGLRRNG